MMFDNQKRQRHPMILALCGAAAWLQTTANLLAAPPPKGLILFSGEMSPDSGSGVDNGTGIVESYFANALLALQPMIDRALTKDTTLSARDRRLLSAIKGSLPLELAQRPLLVFRSGGAEFIIEGVPRIAYTKSAVGAKIYVDQKQLYDKHDQINLPRLGYLMVVQILIHELGHHQGELDHGFLDQLGATVAANLNDSSSGPLSNPGFETASAAGWPGEWGLGSLWNAYIGVNDDFPARGRLSLALTAAAPYGYASVFQCSVIKPDKSSLLRVSFLARPWLSPASHGVPFVQVYDGEGNLESFTLGNYSWAFGQVSYSDITIQGMTAWQYRSVNLNLTRNSNGFCLGFGISGSGTLWIDDVAVETL